MLNNVGLRYPHRAWGRKTLRTLQPLPLLRFAVSATGGAHLCSIQYYLRFRLSSCRTSLAVSALRIMRYCLNPAQPGGGAGWAAGQGTVRVTLAHAQGGVVPGNQKVIQQKLGFGVKIFRCGIGIHQQGGGCAPGESPLVPHSAAAAFQRPAVRGWIPAPRSRRRRRVPHCAARQGCPSRPSRGTPSTRRRRRQRNYAQRQYAGSLAWQGQILRAGYLRPSGWSGWPGRWQGP